MYKCKICGKEFDSKQKLGGHVSSHYRGENYKLNRTNKNTQKSNYNTDTVHFCSFCGKECKNLNSLKQHEIRCTKNSNKILLKSNFIEYNEKIKNNEISKEYTNQYTKADILGLDKPKMTDYTKSKISSAQLNVTWSDERKENHSKTMKDAVNNHPESYSSSNVSGRVKSYDYIDSLNNSIKLKGTWEVCVANYLNFNNIKWTNIIKENITYEFDNKISRYFPDFYLLDYDIYIEVKGYERERDFSKWKAIEDRLILIKKNDILNIKNNNFDIIKIINKK